MSLSVLKTSGWVKWLAALRDLPRGTTADPSLGAFTIYCYICYSYLHSCSPPIIHGNLTTDTIFIQHNGLVKIGSGKVIYQILFG